MVGRPGGHRVPGQRGDQTGHEATGRHRGYRESRPPADDGRRGQSTANASQVETGAKAQQEEAPFPSLPSAGQTARRSQDQRRYRWRRGGDVGREGNRADDTDEGHRGGRRRGFEGGRNAERETMRGEFDDVREQIVIASADRK